MFLTLPTTDSEVCMLSSPLQQSWRVWKLLTISPSSLLQVRQSHFFQSYLLSHFFHISNCTCDFIVGALQLAHDLSEMQNLKPQQAFQVRKDHSRYLSGHVPVFRA